MPRVSDAKEKLMDCRPEFDLGEQLWGDFGG